MTQPLQYNNHRQKGFSLFEVLIFIVISSFLLVSMVSYRVATIRQSRSGYYKIYATRYAEELAEWMRIQKEQDWSAFYAKAGGGGSTVVYCVNNAIDLNTTLEAALTLVNASNCNYDGITSTSSTQPKIFRRTITLTSAASSQLPVQAAILVEWEEGPNQRFSVPINTTYTN